MRRCPVCLCRHQVPDALTDDTLLQCTHCGRTSAFRNWFPVRDLPTDAVLDSPPWVMSPVSRLVAGSLALFLALGTWIGGYHYFRGMKGPDFLVFYLAVLIATWLVSCMVRWTWHDSMAISGVACIIFEGLGVIRLITGLQQGMHKFQGMLGMMCIGGLLFFLRAEHLRNASDGSFGGGCSGCGGGGCGGGCGGCGGCGG